MPGVDELSLARGTESPWELVERAKAVSRIASVVLESGSTKLLRAGTCS